MDMRNLLLRTVLMIVLLAVAGLAFATTVTIGTGTSTQQYPINRYYGYSAWEGIYLSSEIGTNAVINKVAFNKASGADVAAINSVSIYMKQTTATTLATGAYSTTGYTLVYSGTFTNNATTGWMEVTLSNSFAYSNASNLQMLILKGYQAYSSTRPYYYYTASTGRFRQAASDSAMPTSLTASTYLPNVRFDYAAPPAYAVYNQNPASLNFGTVMFNTTTPATTVTISNSGGVDLVINSVVKSGTDAARFILTDPNVGLYPVTLAFGASMTFTVAFNPLATASYTANIDITDNLSKTVHSLPLSGAGLDPTITLGPSTPYSYGFEGTPFPSVGWLNYKATGTGTYLWTQVASGTYPTVSAPHGGAAMGMIQTFSQTAATVVALVTPKVVVPGNDYQVSFWMYRDASSSTSYPNEGVKVYLGSTTTDTLTTQIGYVHRRTNGSPAVATEGWYKYTFNFPASSTGDKYVIFNSFSDYGYNTYIDDISMQQQPAVVLPAIADSPLHNAVDVLKTATLNWHYDSGGPTPTSYKLYFGIDGGGTVTPTSIENGLVITTITPGTYTPSPILAFYQVYYWQVVPYIGTVPAAAACPIWKFTTLPDPTMIPTATQNFDGVTPPALPGGWTTANVNADAYTWITSTGNAVSLPNHLYLRYTAYGTGPQDDWVFTPPVRLTGGTSYTFEFKYKTSSYVEKTAFCWGDAATVVAMSAPLWTLEASQPTYITVKKVVIPTTPGANDYYFGWHAYSAENMGWIYMDDIAVYTTPLTPDAAETPSPANAGTGVGLNPTFTWTAPSSGYSPTGYKFNLGTTLLAPNDIVGNYENNTSLTYTYSGTPLTQGTVYYWQVVPYNGDGPCVFPVTWSFTTGTIPGDVTTPSPTDTNPSVQRNVTFGWAAVTGATSYDLYYGVGTTAPTTGAINVLTTSYIPSTLLLANTGYAWKVVAKNAVGVSPTPANWTFTTNALIVYPTSTATNTADDDIGQLLFAGITNPAVGPPTQLSNPLSNQLYNDYTVTVAPGQVMRQLTYPVTMYQTEYSTTWYDCTFKMYIDYNQNGNFDLPGELIYTGTTGSSSAPNFPLVGVTSAVPSDAPLGLTRLRCVLDEFDVAAPSGTYSYGETEDYMVNVVAYVAAVPGAATVNTPPDGSLGIARAATLNWYPGTGVVTGYKLYFGTDNPPTNLADDKDLYNVLTYPPEDLLTYGQKYFWRIQPYNDLGPTPILDCPVWQFTVMDDPSVTAPYSQNFDGTTFPPAGWVNVKTAGTGTGLWSRATTGVYPTCSPHSGAAMAEFASYGYSAGTKGILVTPPITFDSDDYRVTYWFYRDSSSSYYDNAELVNVYYNTAPDLTGTPTLLGTVYRDVYFDLPTVTAPGWYSYTYPLPVGSTGSGRYIIFEGVSEWGDNMFADDVVIDEPPTTPIIAIDKAKVILPVTTLGGTKSGVFTITNTGVGTLTGTIGYSAGLSGPTAIGTTPFEVTVTYTPTVCGLEAGTVTITSNGSGTPQTVAVESNAGRDIVDCETAPGGWTIWDVNEDANTWGLINNTFGPHTGDWALGISYVALASNDDWVISPWYEIQAGDKLSFYTKTQDPLYPEAGKVLISTTGNTPAAFTTTLLDLPAIPAVYTGYELPLEDYMGMTVCFAFQNYSYDAFYQYLDDIGLPALKVPTPPLTVVATSDPAGVQLDWPTVPGATSYRVYWASDPYAPTWSVLGEASTNSFFDAVPAPYKFYKVVSVNGSKAGNNTHAISAQKPHTVTAPEKSTKNRLKK